MTKLDELNSDINLSESKARFISPFIVRLGNPSNWFHDGTVHDAGKPIAKCICGHFIRWCYVIKNKTNHAQCILGSECVNHFQEYSPSLYQSLQKSIAKTKEAIKTAEKQAKEAQQDAKVDLLKSEYSELFSRIQSVYKTDREAGRRSEYKIWYYMKHSYGRLVHPEYDPGYVRKHSYIKYWEKHLNYVKTAITECKL